MFAFVFLLLGVQGEWVEISQQVFLKPLKHTNQLHKQIYVKPTTTFKTEDTGSLERKPNRIYINSSLTDYNWNKHPDFEDSKWIEDVEDVSIVKVKDKVNIRSDVKSVVKNNINKHGDDKIQPKIDMNNYNKTTSETKVKIIDNVFKNTNKLRRIYFTSSEKPTVIHNTEDVFNDHALEVLSLSDLDYAGTDDIVTAANHNKDIKKHVVATIPVTKDKPKQTVQTNRTKNTEIDKRYGIRKPNTSETNHTTTNKTSEHKETGIKHGTSKFNNRNNTMVNRDQTNRTKNVSTTSKTTSISHTTPSSVIVTTTTRSAIQKAQDKSPAIVKRLSTKAKIQKVQLTTAKPTQRETNNKNESGRDNKKDSLKTDDKPEGHTKKSKNNVRRIETTSMKPVSSTAPTKYQKLLFKPVMKPVLPSPDDIMLTELLKEDENKKNKTDIKITTDTIDSEINKQSSTVTEINQLDKVTKEQTDETTNNGDNDKFEDVFYNNFNTDIDKSDHIQITTIVPTNTLKTEPEQDDIAEAFVETYEHHYHPVLLSESKPEFITKKENFEDTNNNIKIVDENTAYVTPNNKKQDSSTNKPDHKINEMQDLNENVDIIASAIKAKDKEKVPNSLENLVRFLKVVTETISKNARRTLKGKTRYLEVLRDTIMANIEQRIEEEFPNDDAPKRSTRSARGHVEFPSSESALMTISFLTFAVFLIKLVLQLIYAYKYKTMAPAVVATIGRAAIHQFQGSDDT